MLIRFACRNFMCFRDEVVLDLAATADSAHPTHVVEVGPMKLRVLRFAAIYGANAAGKSKLLQALETVWRLVFFGTAPNEKITAIPFLFGAESRIRPSSFEITFASAGRVFRYAFAATQDEVAEEALTEYDADSNEVVLFRRPNSEGASIEFGSSVPGSRTEFHRFLAQGTRKNQLFLAECRLRNGAEFAPAYGWVAQSMLGFTADAISAAGSHVAVLLAANEGVRRELGRFLSSADTHISGIEARVSAVEHSEIMLLKGSAGDLGMGDAKAAPGLMRTYHRDPATGDYRLIEIFAMHDAGSGQQVPLDISAESDGTRELIRLFPMLLSDASHTETVIIDEFGHRIHSLLSQELIRLVAESRLGKQFLFATHDTNLLDLSLLRSDEIIFVEKDRDGASSLRSLAEYRLSSDLRIENGYLAGRFGGIPVLGARIGEFQAASSG